MMMLSTGVPALFERAQGSKRRGGLVVAQEIFGLNANIRALCTRFAGDGFDVIAPAYFDRVEAGFAAPYDQEGIQKGLAAVQATSWDQVTADTQAALEVLSETQSRIFVTGFCWGGTVAWVAACRCSGVTAASGFYGRMINMFLAEAPKVPIELHYGDSDPGIPLSLVNEVRLAHPQISIHIYPAGHGFFSDRGHDFDPTQADLAWTRTLDLFDKAQT
jgi:carboxymethylenebutenolidase